MPTPARARWAAIGLVIFCATLPLQWQALLTVPGLGTLRYFHIGALVMLLLARPSLTSIGRILRASRPVLEGSIGFLALCILTAVGWSSDATDFIQRTVYLTLGLLAGACLLTAFAHEVGRRVLFWASPVTLFVFVIEFGLAMQAAGVAPVTTIKNALVTGNPSVIEFSLFRKSFNATPNAADVRSNARHEIFAALIVVFCVSLAVGAVTRATQIVLVLAGLITLTLLLISQSRTVMLAVALALFLAFVRVVVTRRVRTGTLFIGALVLGTGIVAVPTVGKLLITRLTQSKSYDARISAFNLSSSEITQRLIFGGPRLDVSTHTLVADASLRGGVVAGLFAAVIVLGFAMYAYRFCRTYVLTGSMRSFAAVVPMSLILVRSFTAGGGQLHLVEWLGFGLTMTLWLTRSQAVAATEPATVPVAEPVTPTRAPVPARVGARVGPTALAPAAGPSPAARPDRRPGRPAVAR